jgi:hypothetical protein
MLDSLPVWLPLSMMVRGVVLAWVPSSFRSNTPTLLSLCVVWRV